MDFVAIIIPVSDVVEVKEAEDPHWNFGLYSIFNMEQGVALVDSDYNLLDSSWEKSGWLLSAVKGVDFILTLVSFLLFVHRWLDMSNLAN